MLISGDTLKESLAALRAHKMRAALTMLGLTMGVATLITVITIIQGANVYVETKIANLGTNVFQVTRTPSTVTDFNEIMKALKHKKIEVEDLQAVGVGCEACALVGGTATFGAKARYQDQELQDVNVIGSTPSMADIDTRVVEQGRYFTTAENQRATSVCLIGATFVEKFFVGADPVGRTIRVANEEFTIIGVFEKIGSLLGQEQDRYVVIPMNTFLRLRGRRSSVTINVKAPEPSFQMAQDEVRMVLRARRHITGNKPEDFYVTTKDSYIALWQSISAAFFAVFLMVSAISAIVGGIVIMNVMLVSVTERTKEIGVRRAVGATQGDILKQFLTESVLQCLVGGAIGILAGFACALALRQFTAFPAAVQTWVVVLGVALSSAIGVFFGIYPAHRASKLDPVTALRSD
jgi:putative ABC transport system permease protein